MVEMTLTGGENMTFALFGDSALTFDLGTDSGLVFDISTPTYLDSDIYTGAVDISPDFDGVILATAHKLVTDDIIVAPIQVENVSNTSGGVTVYIGGIV